jgi:hypothetical protein
MSGQSAPTILYQSSWFRRTSVSHDVLQYPFLGFEIEAAVEIRADVTHDLLTGGIVAEDRPCALDRASRFSRQMTDELTIAAAELQLKPD